MAKFDPSSVLSDDEKVAILNQRAKQWGAEAYGHQLNREALLEADPNADTTDIDNALEMLTKAVKHTANKADRLVAERVVE